MILDSISIATQGVYSNDVSLGLASDGYIDIVQDFIGRGFSNHLKESNNAIIIIAICDQII